MAAWEARENYQPITSLSERPMISDLIGRTILFIKDIEKEKLIFICSDNSHYEMAHQQDCCESVELDDVIGNIDDLIGTPVLAASEESNEDLPGKGELYEGSHTWTFYKIATIKGYVTFRWYGASNGYYSESIEFTKIN